MEYVFDGDHDVSQTTGVDSKNKFIGLMFIGMVGDPPQPQHVREHSPHPVSSPLLRNSVLLYFLCELVDKIFQVLEIYYHYALPISGWHIWTTFADVVTCIWAVGTVVS